jgi:hypothetical protein
MRARVVVASLVAGAFGLWAACTADSGACGGGYCAPSLVCIPQIYCCADPAWLATLDGGVLSLFPDGGDAGAAGDAGDAGADAGGGGGGDGGAPVSTCGVAVP